MGAIYDPILGKIRSNKYKRLDFNTSYVTSLTEPIGSQFWDSDNHCLTTVLEYGARLQNGFELYGFGTDEGNDFLEGAAVSVKGATGNRTAFELTDASSTSTNYLDYVGLLTTAPDSGNRFVAKHGLINGIDTTGATLSFGGLETWNEDDQLWVDPANPGYLTNVAPSAPNKSIKVGTITIKSATVGQIDLLRRVMPSLVDLNDVNGTPLSTDGQLPIWHNTEKYFDFDKNINDYLLIANYNLVDGVSAGQMVFWDNGIGKYTYADTNEIYWDDTNKILNTSKMDVAGWLTSKNFEVSNHYTGFPNQTDTSLSWDDVTYTLTLTASADSVWIDGVEYSINTLTKQLTAPQEATTALYWFWITAPGGVPQLNCSDTTPGFDKCLVATVYWNTTTSKGISNCERHWMGRDKLNHEYNHETVGARYASGLAGTFDNTTLTIEAGEYYDEDIEHTNTQQTTAKVFYHNGDADWAWDTLSTPYKVVNPGVDNTLRYNNGNALASVGVAKFTNSWVYISGDTTNPVHIYIDDSEYNTIAQARAATPINRAALTSPEDKLIYRVTYQNVGGTPTYVETADYRMSTPIGTTYTPTDHGALAGLTDYDHDQYLRKAPRVSTEASSATPTIDTDSVEAHSITALATDITSFTTNLSGTPSNFQKLIVRIIDDGTPRSISWGASFAAKGKALPTTTSASKLLSVGFIYNSVTSLWECVASAQET